MLKKIIAVLSICLLIVLSGCSDKNSLDYTKEVVPDAEIIAEESGATLYQGESIMSLMPIDLTLTKSDVPQLIDKLKASNYRAVYIDNDIYLSVTNDDSILISKDKGAVWEKYDTADVDAKDFASWLLKNDPIPGYSMKEMQDRLGDGAEVKHIVFEEGKEMYFVMDRNGVHIELIQAEKIASVLIDGQRMMITSERYPIHISDQMLKSFYDSLVFNNILTEVEAEQGYSEQIEYLKKNDPVFTVTK